MNKILIRIKWKQFDIKNKTKKQKTAKKKIKQKTKRKLWFFLSLSFALLILVLFSVYSIQICNGLLTLVIIQILLSYMAMVLRAKKIKKLWKMKITHYYLCVNKISLQFSHKNANNEDLKRKTNMWYRSHMRLFSLFLIR